MCQKGYLPFILSPKKGVRLGTRGELDNIIKHIQKGCCQDQFGLDAMNVALDPDAEYSDLIHLQGTSQGESTNQLINRMTKDVGRQSADTADKRMWLRVTRFNLSKDEKLRKVLGIKQVRSVEWYLHEAALKQLPALSVYKDIEFPPELPDGYFEPIGLEYSRYKDWNNVRAEMDRWLRSHDQEAASSTNMDIVAPLSPTLATVPPLLQNPLATTASPVAQVAVPVMASDSLSAAAPFAVLPMPTHRWPQQPVDLYAPQARC